MIIIDKLIILLIIFIIVILGLLAFIYFPKDYTPDNQSLDITPVITEKILNQQVIGNTIYTTYFNARTGERYVRRMKIN